MLIELHLLFFMLVLQISSSDKENMRDSKCNVEGNERNNPNLKNKVQQSYNGFNEIGIHLMSEQV